MFSHKLLLKNVQSSAALAGAQPSKGILIQSGYRWLHALAAIGLLAISGAVSAVVFKRSTLLRLKSWIRKVIFEQKQSAEKTSENPVWKKQQQAGPARKC